MTTSQEGLLQGEDGKLRCWWHGGHDDYLHYHDHEWGFPVSDDDRLFEKICLEGFQSGLSWLTILRKRENFRAAFHQFNFHKVAQMTPEDVEALLQNAGIVRHRRKIESTISMLSGPLSWWKSKVHWPVTFGHSNRPPANARLKWITLTCDTLVKHQVALPWAKTSKNEGGVLLAPQQPTPSCKQWAS